MSAKYKGKVERLNRRERKTASGYESSEISMEWSNVVGLLTLKALWAHICVRRKQSVWTMSAYMRLNTAAKFQLHVNPPPHDLTTRFKNSQIFQQNLLHVMFVFTLVGSNLVECQLSSRDNCSGLGFLKYGFRTLDLPIFDVKQQSVRNPARMGEPALVGLVTTTSVWDHSLRDVKLSSKKKLTTVEAESLKRNQKYEKAQNTKVALVLVYGILNRIRKVPSTRQRWIKQGPTDRRKLFAEQRMV
ncbi:hypothetical protein WN51_14473 [Melipona quadrifasciata]|uniref:Uncharacterized protein n=1 Tax=Melipona quadrifasciata TaxID=166423 RepID=A0A0M8ZYC1_9HYME|nr:hypothetical protein WN51_14473 [Melipona quadrifasciata]